MPHPLCSHERTDEHGQTDWVNIVCPLTFRHAPMSHKKEELVILFKGS